MINSEFKAESIQLMNITKQEPAEVLNKKATTTNEYVFG